MAELTNLISTIGFPAVVCLYMIYHNNKTIEKMNDVINENTKATVTLTTLITNFIGLEKTE